MFPYDAGGNGHIPDCQRISWDPWPNAGVPQSSSILEWDFPWNTPSSYWGTPIDGNPKIIAVEQANMAQRIWYSTCCRRFSTPAMLRVRALWNCVRRSMSKRWPVGPFFSWFLVELNMATMATMATTEAFRFWKTWNWNSPCQFVMISCIRIFQQSRWHLTHTSTRPCKGMILWVIWSLAGKLWAPCTSTRIRRRQIPCELLSRQEVASRWMWRDGYGSWEILDLNGQMVKLTNGRCYIAMFDCQRV